MAKMKGMSTSMVEDQKRWETEDDLRAIARAKACQADPERMKRVCKLAKEKLDENKGKKEALQNEIDLGMAAGAK